MSRLGKNYPLEQDKINKIKKMYFEEGIKKSKIARELNISRGTVERWISPLYRKVQANNNKEWKKNNPKEQNWSRINKRRTKNIEKLEKKYFGDQYV